MANTNWINSHRSGRASMLGAAFGSGVNQGLTTILDNLAQQKAEKIRAGHLKNLMPGATDQQVSALSHLGSSVYEPALRGGFGSQQQDSPITMNAQQGPQFEPKPIDFLKALAPIGLSMTPEQEKQISALPIDKQSEIADKIFSKLGDDQKQKIQQYWENPQQFAQQRQMGNQSPMQGQPQQQVLGSQQPGIAPAQNPQITPSISQPTSISESIRRGSGKSVSENIAREKFESAQEEKQQKRIKSENAPFTKRLEKEVPIATTMLSKVNEMLQMEQKNETPNNKLTKAIGTYSPGVLNPWNAYDALSNEIAALKSQATGKPSVFMTQLMKTTKPNLSMDKKDRVNFLQKLKESAEAILGVEEASRDIVEENNGNQPINLQRKAEDLFFERVLPSLEKYDTNTLIELYSHKFKAAPNRWVRLKVGQ